MSITFTPTDGIVTTYNYYAHDPRDPAMPGDDVANGVIRFANDEPSCNFANGNAIYLIKRLGMVPADSTDNYVGSYPQEAIDELLENIDRLISITDDEPCLHRLGALKNVVLHCKYHGCGFTWG